MKKLIVALALFVPVVLWAQEAEALDMYDDIFSEPLVQAVLAIIAGTKLIRNAIPGNLKGMPALLLTFAVSIGYGVYRYGLSEGMWWYGAFAGFLAAASFYLTKNNGKIFGGDYKYTSLVDAIRYFLTRNVKLNEMLKPRKG